MKQEQLVILNSRKALNFDLDDHLLKKYYPLKNYKKGWKDIRCFLEKHGFIHRQYSGYVSKEFISISDTIYIVASLAFYMDWLKYCVKQFDLTVVVNEYSLLHHIQGKKNSYFRL